MSRDAPHALAVIAQALRRPAVRMAALAAAVGAAGFLVFGVTPASTARPSGASPDWALPAPHAGVDDAMAALASAAVWASQPAPVVPGAVAQVPPRLVGVVSEGAGRRFALLQWSDGRQQRVGVGDDIPGEGRMREITATTARWRRDDGSRVEAQLFLNQDPRVVANDDPPANDE